MEQISTAPQTVDLPADAASRPRFFSWERTRANDRRAKGTAAADPLAQFQLPPTPRTPLLTPKLVTGNQEVITVADPFPVSCDGVLFVLAEIEGSRRGGDYFKKLGAFAIDDDLKTGRYLGELWPADDGEYSFPYVVCDGGRLLLVPDVNTPGQPADKRFRIYACDPSAFPFGWKLLVETQLPGAARPSDKVLIRHNDRWWLWVSDSQNGGRLLLYSSDNLRDWSPHPGNPLLHRPAWQRAANRLLPPTLFRVRPWRLGGGAAVLDGCPVLFVQHMYRRAIYGEAVTPLLITQLSERRVEFELAAAPMLAAQEDVAWQSQSAHHVAFARHGDQCVVTTDGFDGTRWSSTIQQMPAGNHFVPWGADHA